MQEDIGYLLVSSVNDAKPVFEVPVKSGFIRLGLKDYINFEQHCWTDSELVTSPEWEAKCPLQVVSVTMYSIVLSNVALVKSLMALVDEGKDPSINGLRIKDTTFSFKRDDGVRQEIEWNGSKYTIEYISKSTL